jgi:hypothetical protein
VESVDSPPESADVQARISHPPITPITEDPSTSVRDSNLCKSVESVDNPPGPSSAESADVRSGHSISRSLDPSIPSGSHSVPRSLDLSLPSGSHSISRSLDPSISSELP